MISYVEDDMFPGDNLDRSWVDCNTQYLMSHILYMICKRGVWLIVMHRGLSMRHNV